MNEKIVELESRNQQLETDLSEALAALENLVERRYAASFGTLQSTDGRYEKAFAVLQKHNTKFTRTVAGRNVFR